jgi:hypothetical protein
MNPLTTPKREKLLRETPRPRATGVHVGDYFAVSLWVFLIATYLITNPTL